MRAPAKLLRLQIWGAALMLAVAQAGCSKSPQDTAAPAKTADSLDVSVMDLVEECDVLAAHPEDPQRMAEGVDDDKIVPRLAVLACESAMKKQPEDPRFPFQLGRSVLARGDKDKALTLFQDAAKKGYAAAYGYMGDAYQFGYGVAVNPAAALENYRKAADGGFEAAKNQIDQLNFDRSIFAVSEYIDALFTPDLNKLQTNSATADISPVVRNYIYTLTNQLTEECGQVVLPANVVGFYSYRYPSGWTPQADEPVGVAIQTALGEYDAKAFLKRHGCGGPVAKHIFASLNNFFARYR
jgi:hypothetical protein